MIILKALEGDGYRQELYTANISQQYTIFSGSDNGTNPESVIIDIAEKPPEDWKFTLDSGYINPISGLGSYSVYGLLHRAFYSDKPIVDYGIPTLEATKFDLPDSLYVINVSANILGNGIVPGTFSANVLGSSPALDDGFGRVYVEDPENVIGNIYYKHGIAILKNNVSAPTQSISVDGISLKPLQEVNVAFTSSEEIVEHTSICKILPSEFNFSVFNPSVGYYREVTGSYTSGSEEIIYKNLVPSTAPSTTALSGETVADLFNSGTLVPYVTTIGLYSGYDLVAVAKLANPVPRTKNVDQTFIVKFDT